MSYDYEGDSNYLSLDDLDSFCLWLHQHDKNNTFYYTISVRSSLYDILEKKTAETNNYLLRLLTIYKNYSNLRFILVVGNKKYLSSKVERFSYSDRLEKFVKILKRLDSNRSIYLGADKIFLLTKKLLNKYSNTIAIFLFNPFITEQLKEFHKFSKSRLTIYSLYAKSRTEAIQNENARQYLFRRGVSLTDIDKFIHLYVKINDTKIINIVEKDYFWFYYYL